MSKKTRFWRRLAAISACCSIWGCGSDGGEPSGGPDKPAPSFSADSLGATGLYSDLAGDVLAEGVREYRPEIELWSDGASKRRWVQIPEGEVIETSDMDNWSFPVGTRAWKEFTRDGVRVETRLLEKTAVGQWDMVAYVWREDGSDALAAPDGVANALGTEHDVPEGKDCQSCHDGMSDTLIGVSAVQLDHDLGGLTLAELAREGLLSHAPTGALDPPGDGVARAALGYLHANCGNCHNERNSFLALRLWLRADELGSVEATGAYRTSVDVTAEKSLDGHPATRIIAPGDPNMSLLHERMVRRTKGAMPTVGSEVPDDTGIALVADWIRSL